MDKFYEERKSEIEKKLYKKYLENNKSPRSIREKVQVSNFNTVSIIFLVLSIVFLFFSLVLYGIILKLVLILLSMAFFILFIFFLYFY